MKTKLTKAQWRMLREAASAEFSISGRRIEPFCVLKNLGFVEDTRWRTAGYNGSRIETTVRITNLGRAELR